MCIFTPANFYSGISDVIKQYGIDVWNGLSNIRKNLSMGRRKNRVSKERVGSNSMGSYLIYLENKVRTGQRNVDEFSPRRTLQCRLPTKYLRT